MATALKAYWILLEAPKAQIQPSVTTNTNVAIKTIAEMMRKEMSLTEARVFVFVTIVI